MDKIAFVILHYKVAEITVQCVEYILNQNYDAFKIIIVDNHSDNGTCEQLCNRYNGNNKIEIISLERNYGFAKGNDIGFLFAKYNYQADYIVVLNNDLMIEDRNFCKKLVSLELDANIGVIGPDIINLEGEHQNPKMDCITSMSGLRKAILITKVKLLLIPALYALRGLKKHYVMPETKHTETQRNVPLHGACLIFVKQYIERVQYAFFPDTFLYVEEEFLYYNIRRMGLQTLYVHDLWVKHLEDVSTKSISKNAKQKRLFELRNALTSMLKLKEQWQQDHFI